MVPDVWKRGKYIDSWSFVHFLSGILLGAVAFILGFSLFWSAILTSLILLLWEVFEWSVKIIEKPLNVLTDIVIGLVGFSLSAYLQFMLNKPFPFPALALIFSIALLLSVWGFSTYVVRSRRKS